MDGLKLTDNAKTKFKKNHYNTFGLYHGLPKNGGTCPCATKGPGGCLALKREGGTVTTCYMDKLVHARPNIGKALRFNTDLMKGKTRAEMLEELSRMMDDFIERSGGTDLYFRPHYSGDFFSDDYAKAWVDLVKKYAHVRFWMYTRCFQYIRLFANIANVSIYLSVDPVNYDVGLKVFKKFKDAPNVGMAFMGNEAPEGQRWVICPETSGKLKNSEAHGTCQKCRLCIDRYHDKIKNVQFLIH